MNRKPKTYSLWVGLLFSVGLAMSGLPIYSQFRTLYPIRTWSALGVLSLLVLINWVFVWRSPKMHESGPLEEPSFKPPTPEEVRVAVLVFIGDLCGFLKEYGKPVESPPRNDPFGGLGDIPDDEDIKNEFPKRFGRRLSDVKNLLGGLAMLGTPFSFSNIGDVLGNREVRNAEDVRKIIECLEVAAKEIKNKYIGSDPEKLVSIHDAAKDFAKRENLKTYVRTGIQATELFSPLQMEAFQLAKELRDFLKEIGPHPEIMKENGQLDQRAAVKYTEWSAKLISGYRGRFAPKVESFRVRVGQLGLTSCYGLDAWTQGVKEEIELQLCAQTLELIALELGSIGEIRFSREEVKAMTPKDKLSLMEAYPGFKELASYYSRT